jgi:hypothetical protein
MSKGNLNKKHSARDDVVFTDLDDGSAVLLHLQTKYYFSLNETGCFLWKLLEREHGASEEEMAVELCEAFDVESDRAKSDVQEFLQDLQEQGLIK